MGINQGPISLDQKYTQGSGHVFLTGIQALVRLPMAQIRRDRANGLNTAGLVSGYRGSPLGGYDQQLFAARKHLEQYNIKFQPGVNEDLAATAIWGSQQLNLSPGARHDGAGQFGRSSLHNDAAAQTAPVAVGVRDIICDRTILHIQSIFGSNCTAATICLIA